MVFIAATNKRNSNKLDPELLRPGRLDLQFPVPLPDVRGRAKILRVKKGKMERKIDLSNIARGTPGLSGEILINQVALTKEGVQVVLMHDLEFAKDKLLMGSARKSAIISTLDLVPSMQEIQEIKTTAGKYYKLRFLLWSNTLKALKWTRNPGSQSLQK